MRYLELTKSDGSTGLLAEADILHMICKASSTKGYTVDKMRVAFSVLDKIEQLKTSDTQVLELEEHEFTFVRNTYLETKFVIMDRTIVSLWDKIEESFKHKMPKVRADS